MQTEPNHPTLIRSYHQLRRAIGYLGVALPFLLVLGKSIFEGGGIEPSISDYYYTAMRDVFVGCLFAIGVFLWSYEGYDDGPDNKVGNIACIGALGTALFPTTPELPNLWQEIFGYFHYVFAVGFLGSLAYFSIFLFTKTGNQPPTPAKLVRNRIYKYCGFAIAGSILAMVLFVATKKLVGYSVPQWLDVVFWLETIAVMSFGFSWLIKGRTLFRDREK